MHFDAEPGSNAIQFIKGYEHLSANWSDQTRKLNLAQYLKGAAASWMELVEITCRGEPDYDDTGALSNRLLLILQTRSSRVWNLLHL
jgi:hypothetical protein